ncbi:Hypothetical predicted protein, partial [Paramuricea clavata]
MKQCDKRCRKCQGLHHQSICKGQDHPKELSKKQEIPKGPVKADPVGPTVATSTVNQHSTTHGKKEKLGLDSLRTETLNLNTFGDDRVTKQRCHEVKIKLEARPENFEISALTFSKICSPLSMKLDVEAHPHLHGLQLADSSLSKDVPTNIDILIGSDHYFDVVTDEIRRGQRGPVAINTIFGWVISGPTQNADKDNSSSTNLIILRENSDPMKNSFAFEDKNQGLTNELRRFWDTESLGIQDEKMGNDNFLNELIYHNDEKRFE